MSRCKCSKLNSVAFGLSLAMIGIISAALMLLSACYGGVAKPMVDMISNMYGLDLASMKGMIMLGLMSAIKSFVVGFLIAMFYNLFNCACHCCCCASKKSECCDDVCDAPVVEKKVKKTKKAE